MNKRVLKTLEYNKIIDLLVEKATSDPGRILCKDLVPICDLELIEMTQLQTQDAIDRLLKKDSISFGSTYDFETICKQLEIGISISMADLLKIAKFLENTARVKQFGRFDKEKTQPDSLSPYFDELEPLTPLCTRIRSCILSEDEMADDASSQLKNLRRQISHLSDKIHTQLVSLMNGSYRSYLQDAVITLRNNRYCIPVKTEHKNQVPGMIHDQSQTGSTLFIEPSSIVSLNNQIKEQELLVEQEIERILYELSMECAVHQDLILQNMKTMAFLDFVFAKAKFSLSMNGSRPLFNQTGYIHIKKGRHPMLDPQKVVPIDVILGGEYHQLIITGPNTGGKTVSIKTVGLFTLMGQAGLQIPAMDRSELTVFKEVFADIGDEQSIEQSLSTFSSHMTNIISILEQADASCLCLFDELCAGTDPTEGAALAIAILETLRNRKATTMATTHYSELKLYALSTPSVENASCEFNLETLTPTYRLFIGIPGKSNAFAISSKLGLPSDIIAIAKEQISSEDETFEDLIADLEKSRKTIEQERIEIARYKKEVESLKDSLSKKQEKMDLAKERILREANDQAKDLILEAKTLADETIRNFQKYDSRSQIREMEDSRTKLREKVKEIDYKTAIKKETVTNRISPKSLKLGDTVKVLSLNAKGSVSSLPDAKGNLFVQCGIIRSKVSIKDLVLIEDQSIAQTLESTSFSSIRRQKSSTIRPEINLLGCKVDEALSKLDKYLDDAYLSPLKSVRIVHGKGTGALRTAIWSHLKTLSYIKSFRPGDYGEGDAGVTIAEFK